MNSPYWRVCAMCRERFEGFRATWTDICAKCDPKRRKLEAAVRRAACEEATDE